MESQAGAKAVATQNFRVFTRKCRNISIGFRKRLPLDRYVSTLFKFGVEITGNHSANAVLANPNNEFYDILCSGFLCSILCLQSGFPLVECCNTIQQNNSA